MDNILPIIAGGALVLACPLGMVAMGVVPWLMARARGQKRQLSVGCIPEHGGEPTERMKTGT